MKQQTTEARRLPGRWKWSQARESNPQHPAYKAGVLPFERARLGKSCGGLLRGFAADAAQLVAETKTISRTNHPIRV